MHGDVLAWLALCASGDWEKERFEDTSEHLLIST